MVLEQGALSARYDEAHPFPEETGRGNSYNSYWKEIGKLVEALREIGKAHGAKPSQIAGAWAIAKGTLPIIGVTKVYQVEEAAKMADIHPTGDEISSLESLADKAGIPRFVNGKRRWHDESTGHLCKRKKERKHSNHDAEGLRSP